MAYTTIAQVKLNHEKIPENDKMDATITMHIVFVDAYIDGKIRGKISLPFAGATPPVIAMIALDLTTWRTLRSLYGAQISDEYQSWIDEYKVPANQILDDLADCKISLDGDLATAFVRVKSTTAGKEAIFDLSDPYSQDYHPTDGDDRYGEV